MSFRGGIQVETLAALGFFALMGAAYLIMIAMILGILGKILGMFFRS